MVDGAPAEVMLMHGSHNFANMAAHGGWVASAVDLVRFASSFDDPAACPVLSASWIESATLALPCPDDPRKPEDDAVPGTWPGLLASVRTWIAGVTSWPSDDDSSSTQVGSCCHPNRRHTGAPP